MLTGLSGLSGLSGVAGGPFTPASLPSLVVAPIVAASFAAGKLFQDASDTTPSTDGTKIRHLLTPPYGGALTVTGVTSGLSPTLNIDGSVSYATFNGTDQYWDMPDSTLPAGSSDRTIGIVFRLNALGVIHGLFSYGTPDFEQSVFLRVAADNTIDVTQYGASIAGTTTVLTTGRWYRLIVTVASGVWTAWLDGVPEGTPTAMGTNTVLTGNARIGVDILNQFANADIAGVPICSAALSVARVLQLDAYLAGLVATAGTAYVTTGGNDSTGTVNDAGLPFLTLAKAVQAVTPGSTVSVGAGTFASLLHVPQRLTIAGNAKPSFNDSTTPTALTGGTIFQGPFNATSPSSSFSLFGVDVGSDVCTASYGGTAQEGLYVDSPVAITGPTISNVAVLCKAKASAVHAFRIENQVTNSTMTECSTFFGAYGLAAKASGITDTNHVAKSHGYAVIVKAETGQTTTATITNLTSTSSDLGLAVQGNGGTLTSCTLTTATISGGDGVRFLGTGAVGTVSVSGVTVTSGVDYGFDEDGTRTVTAFNLTNCSTAGAGTVGVRVGASCASSTITGLTQTAGGVWGALLYGPSIRLDTVSFAQTIFVDAAAYVSAPSPASVVGTVSGTIHYDTP